MSARAAISTASWWSRSGSSAGACRRGAAAICASSRARMASGWRAGDASASSTSRAIASSCRRGSPPAPDLRRSRASFRAAIRRADAGLEVAGQRRRPAPPRRPRPRSRRRRARRADRRGRRASPPPAASRRPTASSSARRTSSLTRTFGAAAPRVTVRLSWPWPRVKRLQDLPARLLADGVEARRACARRTSSPRPLTVLISQAH